MTRDEGPPAAITSRLNSCNREAPSPSLCSHLKAAPVFWHRSGGNCCTEQGSQRLPIPQPLCHPGEPSVLCAAIWISWCWALELLRCRWKSRLSSGLPWQGTNEGCLSAAPSAGSLQEWVLMAPGWLVSSAQRRGLWTAGLASSSPFAVTIRQLWLFQHYHRLAVLLSCFWWGEEEDFFFIVPMALEDLGIHTTLCITRFLKRKGLLTEKTPDNSYTVGEDGAGGILG